MTVITNSNNKYNNNNNNTSTTNSKNAFKLYTTQYIPDSNTRITPTNNSAAYNKNNITVNNAHITSLQQQQHYNKLQTQLPL